jgi:hypothetical protein
VRWVGARLERGHRLRERKAGGWPAPALTRRAGALVLGGGVAGLSALRALVRAGVDDAQLLELEDTVGGNARGHQLAGQGCPLGAHYLPVPGPTAHEVGEWLHEIGLLQWDGLRGASRPDERFLCHAPQERLFIDGAWQEGQLPSAAGRPPRWTSTAALPGGWPRPAAWALPCPPGARPGRRPTPRWTARPSPPGWPPRAWTTPACGPTWTTPAATTTAPGWTRSRPGPGCITSPAGTASTPRASRPRPIRACSPGPRAMAGSRNAWLSR